jgi:hypothetical protein
MTGAERDAYESSFLQRDGKMDVRSAWKNLRARMCVTCIVDENGDQVFTDADVADLSRLGSAGLHRVFMVAQRLSGLSESDVEELAGNSTATQGD